MTEHASDCAVHNAPAMEPGACDCEAIDRVRAVALKMAIDAFPDGIYWHDAAEAAVKHACIFEAYLRGDTTA